MRLLAPTGADIELSKPIRNGQCGTPAPVVLKRVSGVELNPPAVVNCRVAAKVHEWINESVQPLARETLGTARNAYHHSLGLHVPATNRLFQPAAQ